jgi:hypothetical protein
MSNLADFKELCLDYADWWHQGILEKIDAVDCVQRHAELWGVVDEIGQDEVQRLIAEAFAPAAVTEPEPSPERAPPRRYSTRQSTIDAFNYVVGLGDAQRLADWLRNHPNDSAVLLQQVEAA